MSSEPGAAQIDRSFLNRQIGSCLHISGSEISLFDQLYE